MKLQKTISLLLILCLLAALAACGGSKPAEPVPTQAPAAETAVAETPAPTPEPAPETPVPTEEPAPQELSDLEKAMACKGLSIEELYAAVGEPQAPGDYIPSCLHPNSGGEDGELVYDGFTVYTYRDNTGEIVYDVMGN